MLPPRKILRKGALYKLDGAPMYWMYVGVNDYKGQSTRVFRGIDGGILYLLPERADELLAPRIAPYQFVELNRQNLTLREENARIPSLEEDLLRLKRENKAMKKLLKQAEKLLLIEHE